MEKNFEEVIADMLIQLANMEQRFKQDSARFEAFEKRMEFTIKRMVKAEARIEAAEKRMELFDEKLEQSIKDQRQFSETQNKINKFFLEYIRKNSGKK